MAKQPKEILTKKGFTSDEQIHLVELKNRKELLLVGVLEVFNFSDTVVAIHTLQGEMIISGEGLTMKNLDLDAGQMSIDGLVTTIAYQSIDKKKGLWKRLFK